MPKLETRYKTVRLFPGHIDAELDLLLKKAIDAEEEQRKAGGRRFSQGDQAIVFAQEYDAAKDAAEAGEVVEVKVYAIDFRLWGALADEHPPREGEGRDKQYGVNMKTFPDDLAVCSLAEVVDTTVIDGPPGAAAIPTVAQLRTLGQLFLSDLGSLNRAQWVKIVDAAWEVNTGSDDLPKFSAVSRLQAMRETSSRRRKPGESTPDD